MCKKWVRYMKNLETSQDHHNLRSSPPSSSKKLRFYSWHSFIHSKLRKSTSCLGVTRHLIHKCQVFSNPKQIIHISRLSYFKHHKPTLNHLSFWNAVSCYIYFTQLWTRQAHRAQAWPFYKVKSPCARNKESISCYVWRGIYFPCERRQPKKWR